MFIIEGNIGAGKSTFLKLLQNKLPEVNIALEPVHDWQKKVYGQSLLANFYQNPQRWAYSIETFAMMCRVRDHLVNQQEKETIFIERSIYSGHYCFSQNGYENGFMTTLEWQLYCKWFEFLIPGKCNPPQGFIYLSVRPDVAYKRIKKRNRLAEKKITLAYLKQIHQKHEDFLIHKKDILPDLQQVPVLQLDCNQEFESDDKVFQKHLAKVDDFVKSYSKHSFTHFVPRDFQSLKNPEI